MSLENEYLVVSEDEVGTDGMEFEACSDYLKINVIIKNIYLIVIKKMSEL